MAILNFAKTYNEISGYLGAAEGLLGDYVKLFFSKDGHIISHGKDFTPTFTPSERGLVPLSSGKTTEILRGDGTWAEITTSDLPMASSPSAATSTTLLSALLIIEYVNSSFAANDAMRYKGTISRVNGEYTHTTTAGLDIPGFPSECEIGDTYRVTSSGEYAGHKCSYGDLLICIKNGTGEIDTIEYWTAVETNINGEVYHRVNNTPIPTYSSSLNTFTIFAPITGGVSGLVLISNGNAAPEWINQNLISTKTANPLLAGAGLTLGGGSFDGSAEKTMSLVAATSTTIGGVIIDLDNTNKTISVSSTGSIYLNRLNIINALGYDPVSKNTWRPITIGGVSIGEKTLNFVPSEDIYLKPSSNDDVQDISFGINWWNISEGAWETE